MTALHTMDEVAHRLRKSRRWLQDFLRKHPTDRSGEPLYRKAGRTTLFTDDDLSRLTRLIGPPKTVVPQWVMDAANMLPIPAREDGSVVYFARAGDFIKIGFSRKWRGRISHLQTGSPLPLELLHVEPGNVAKERALHRHFKHLHSHREWFRAGYDLLAYIERLKGYRH